MADPVTSREDIASLLKWYVDQGLDEAVGEVAIDRFAAPPPAAAPASASPHTSTPIRPAA